MNMTDPVKLVFDEIMSLYNLLSPEEQRELERRLYAEPAFGRLMKRRINLYTKEWVLLRRKDSRRSRKPNEGLNEKVVRLRDQDKKSFGEIGRAIGCSADAARKRYIRSKSENTPDV
jgi:hypothetical protein